jgi:2-polyprenyl-3-methyl-5-hydroxy-6-metoxy-1,4-benzoquinol methylase
MSRDRQSTLTAKQRLERSAPHDRGADVHLRSPAQMREYDAIADRIAADRPGRVLDWGAGHGQLSDLLLQRGVAVTAMDYEPEATEGEVVRPPRYPRVEITLTTDPVRLPYPDASFDAALSMGVLEHVAHPAESLDELHRVLRPGGTLYVYKLPNRRSYLEALAKRAGLYYHGHLPDDTLYTRPVARDLLQAHGFAIAELRLANMLPLGITGRGGERFGDAIWAANRALARVPGLNQVATNVELVARRIS